MIFIGAEVLRNGTTTEGTVPVYSCTLTTSSTLSCTPTINIICGHSMDLGVVCKTYQDVIGSVINRTIDQTLQTCPEPTTNNEVRSCDSTVSPIATLGGVIGLMVVVLIGLVIGLTVTCWVLGKRRKQKQQAE